MQETQEHHLGMVPESNPNVFIQPCRCYCIQNPTRNKAGQASVMNLLSLFPAVCSVTYALKKSFAGSLWAASKATCAVVAPSPVTRAAMRRSRTREYFS